MLYSLHFHRCSNAKVLYFSHFHLTGALGGTLGRAARESAVLFAFQRVQQRESALLFAFPPARRPRGDPRPRGQRKCCTLRISREREHRERYSSRFHIPGALGGTRGQPEKVLYSLHESPGNPERFLKTAERKRGEDSCQRLEEPLAQRITKKKFFWALRAGERERGNAN